MASNSFGKSLKGFVVYDLVDKFDLSKILSLDNFSALRYQPAKENEFESIGFLPTVELEVDEDGVVIREEEFVTNVQNFSVIKIGTSKKQIPATAVKRKTEELIKKAQVDAKEKGEEFVLDKDLKDFFKDQATKLVLPECKNFVDEFETYLFQDKGTERLYVLQGNYKKAESFTGFLRTLLGSVPTFPLKTEKPVGDALTNFVSRELDEKLTLDSHVKLEGPTGMVVVWDKESVFDSGAKALIDGENFFVTKLGMQYSTSVTFILDDECAFNSVKFDKSFLQRGSDFVTEFLDVANELQKVVREVVKEVNKDVTK